MHPIFRLAVFALVFIPGPGGATPIILRVQAQASIPPKWIMGAGKPSGVCPDILAAIEKIEPRLRFAPNIEARSIPLLEQGLEHGSIDAVCALLDTERRRQIARIVGPALYVVRHRLAARRDDGVVVASMDELLRLKPLINTQRSAGYAIQLRALGLEVDDSAGDNTVNLNKIIAGHGRFFYLNELTLTWFLAREPFKSKVRVLDWVVKEEPIYFHVSKKAPEGSAQLVEQALVKLKANGELARIYAGWAQTR